MNEDCRCPGDYDQDEYIRNEEDYFTFMQIVEMIQGGMVCHG